MTGISVAGQRGFQRKPAIAAPIIDAAALPPLAPAPSFADSAPAPAVALDAAEPGKAPFVRKPFGQHRQKLNFPKRAGYHRHIFNDERGRIGTALEAGYTHVVDETTGRNVSIVVGVAEGGGPLVGYLMELPEEWYREDMAAQQREVDKTDEAIHRGNVQGTVGQDGRYIPSRGINISTK